MRAQRTAAAGSSGDPPDTADLIGRAAAGDRAAFNELVRRYHATIYRWAAVALGDLDDAEDVTQLVLIRVSSSLRNYQGGARFTTWLYRVTRNVLLEQVRTRRRRTRLFEAEQNRATEDDHGEPADRSLDSGKLELAVLGHLGSLPPRQREVFELADIQGFAPVEIAVMLDVEPVTVRTNLLKARRALRERLLAQQPKLIEEYRT
jgi:RNA polymerase sigma-70 factor (ECF subfamily)